MSNYWERREREANIERRKKNDAQLLREVFASYNRSLKLVKKEIRELLQDSYGNDEYLVDSLYRKVYNYELEALKKKVDELRKGDTPLSEHAKEELKELVRLRKLNRLELLKTEIDLEIIKMTNENQYIIEKNFVENVLEHHRELASFLDVPVAFNEKHAISITYASFHNAKWSSRLWLEQKKLRKKLELLIEEVLTLGKHPRTVASRLVKEFGVSKKVAERLLITETTRIQSETFKLTAEEFGETDYEWIAEPNACPLCSALNGTAVKTTIPPRHPNCRCALSFNTNKMRERYVKKYGKEE